MNQFASRLILVAIALVGGACWAPAVAQTTRVPPHPQFVFASERAVGNVVVQQWVRATSPEISPAGMCECITVVHYDGRPVLTLGQLDLLSATTVHDISGRDINADGYVDVVVTDWSGGAHCCYSINIYSLEPAPRALLSLGTGNCGPGELVDLNGDGGLELVTCDDQWASAYCAFALSPMPRVVFAYDPAARTYVPATPRFAGRFPDELRTAVTDAEREMAGTLDRSRDGDKCSVLRPALMLMYEGRLAEGVTLLRRLYVHADREQFEQETLARLRSSPLWREAQ